MFNQIVFGLCAVCLLALISVVVLLRRERQARCRFEKKFQAMEILLKNSRQQHQSLEKQLHEIRAGSIGMSQKLVELSQRFSVLLEKHNHLEMNDADGRLYTRASKMVDLGADLDELMEECDLPKAEAELLLTLKKHRMAR